MEISKINRVERQELLSMLANLNSWSNRTSYKRKPLPVELRKWQKRISKFERGEREAQERFTKSWERQISAIRKEIYFGTAKKALAMMEAVLGKGDQ